jgi:hypothetical protein
MVTSNACHDRLRQTVFHEPAHDIGHGPIAGWVMAAAPRP